MPNSQPRQQRGYPQPQQYPPYGAPPMAQQQMHPGPQMHEGYGHQQPPPYGQTGAPGYPPPQAPHPSYHPGHGAYPPYAYPPAGYSQPFYPPTGQSPPQYPYPPQSHPPAPMNPPSNQRQHDDKNSSPLKNDKSPSQGDRKKGDALESNSLSKTSPPKQQNATEEVDDMTSRVNPMRSDFHFYADENKKEVEKSTEKKEMSSVELISELNEKLIEMWEKESASTRSEYMAKEERDRGRFMNEDEIESRHCATLTSRPKPYAHLKPEIKSDGVSKVVTKDEEDEEQENQLAGSKRANGVETETKEVEDYESPLKKNKERSDPPKSDESIVKAENKTKEGK